MNSERALTVYKVDTGTELSLPYADGGIKAGFPSPAQDYIELSIDLNKELIRNLASTFYGRVSGDSMKDADLDDGDIVIIDKSLKPQDGDMAVCFIDGDFTIKFLEIHPDHILLIPANKNYQPIKAAPESDFKVWGIVTRIIKEPRKRGK